MAGGPATRDRRCMTAASTRMPQSPTAFAVPPPSSGVMLTRSDFSELTDELDLLRATHRADLAARLRDARSFGSPGDDDDWLSVVEDAAIERGRIAQLERLVATARIVDDPPSTDAGVAAFRQPRDPEGMPGSGPTGWRTRLRQPT